MLKRMLRRTLGALVCTALGLGVADVPSGGPRPAAAEQKKDERSEQAAAPAAESAPNARDSAPLNNRFSAVVTASRTELRPSESPVPVSVISRQDIERAGARDLAELLSLDPAVRIDRGVGGAGVSVQGLDPQQVLILVDGQRLVGRVDGVLDLSRIPVDRIEQVEIVRGAGSALYGSDALGGIIHVRTRRARRPIEADASAQYGSLNAVDVRTFVGTSLPRAAISLSAGLHKRDAYDLDPSTPSTSGSGYLTWQVSGRADLRPHDRVRLLATGEYLRRRQDGIDAFPGGAVLDRTNLTETAMAQLTPELRAGRITLRTSLQYSFFRDQFRLDQRRANALDQYQDTREHLARFETQLDARLPGGHLLTGGGEVLYERLYSERLSGGSGDRVRGAVYVQDQWTPPGDLKMSLVPALRFDGDSQFGQALSPKLALLIQAFPWLTLRASYGAGFRAPSFKELLLRFENPGAGYAVNGNLGLKPETAHGLNAGFELNPISAFTLTANFYHNTISNLIQFDVAPGGTPGMQLFQYENIASAYTQGVELGARLGIGQVLRLDGGYVLTDARDVATGQALAGRARHRGTLSINVRTSDGGATFTVRAALIGPAPYYADDNGDGVEEAIEAPAYAPVDARLALRLSKHAEFYVGMQNILNAGDTRFIQIPPRMAYLGIQGKY